MASETLRNGNGNGNGMTEAPPATLRRGMADVAYDMATLAELQVKLLKADVQDIRGRIIVPAILGVVAAVVLLASLPVAMLALAAVLFEEAKLTMASSLGLSALAGLVLAGILGGVCWFLMRNVFSPIGRSQTELSRNVQWVKHVLKNSGRTFR